MKFSIFSNNRRESNQQSKKNDTTEGRQRKSKSQRPHKISIATNQSPITLRLKAIEEDREECPVCAERFQIDSTVTLLPCQHYFCQSCAVQWLSRNCTCPVCRFKLRKAPEMKRAEIPTKFTNMKRNCMDFNDDGWSCDQHLGNNFDLIMAQALRVRNEIRRKALEISDDSTI